MRHLWMVCFLWGCTLDRQGNAVVESTASSVASTGEGPLSSAQASTGAGGANVGGSGGSAPCPTGMRFVDHASGAYCVDRTEVTSVQYQQFLDAQPDPDDLDPPCDWNDDFAPRSSGNQCTPLHFDPVNLPNRPVACVDWCDAFAYCQWAGKHLCGRVGGGENDFLAHADTNLSEWYHACSGGGTKAFPYGSTYQATTCVGDDYDGVPNDGASDEAIDVGAASGCQGGYPELFDMSGNVWEWENSCQAGGDAEYDLCHDRGGSFWDGANALGCDSPGASNHLRGYYNKNIGFRCCAQVM